MKPFVAVSQKNVEVVLTEKNEYVYFPSRNQTLPSPKKRLFASYEQPLSDKQIQDLHEEGKFFLACDAMKHGEDELAVEQFEQLNMAEASYYQAQVRGSYYSTQPIG